MNRFIVKAAMLLTVFIGVNIVLLFGLSENGSDYLYEYNHKLQLLDTVGQPRIIFMGGSSAAFDNDSRTIRDSLGCNVINFGLHAGIGMRIPLEDGLRSIRKGDVVVVQIEYANFFNGGNGEPEALPAFMTATKWREWNRLNANQWMKLIQGIPRNNISNLVHLARRFKTGPNVAFVYTKDGFNEFGDEVSHLNYPSQKYLPTGKKNTKAINTDFIEWLGHILAQYEERGSHVIMMPPACIVSCFNESYNDNVKEALETIHYPYVIEPSYMALDDDYMFNTGYHLNREGVRKNTANLIRVLRDCVYGAAIGHINTYSPESGD